MRKYFEFIVLVLAVVSVFAAEPKLNIMFILADDFGWHDLGSHGSTFYETPNPDYKPGAATNSKPEPRL